MKRIIKIGLFCTPFIIGLFGFIYAGVSVRDSAFNSLELYLLNYGDPADNIAIEIARWTAPIATASGLISIVMRYAISVKNFIRNRRRQSVAIYGDSPEAEYIKSQVGNRLITPIENQLVKAHRYVLMMEDQENLEFYAANREYLKHYPVCIRCSTVSSQEIAGDKLKIYDPEEIAARLFWKQSGIFELAEKCGYRMSIAMIGFGNLGQELLLKGLQYNIFSLDQRIEYHIYGDAAYFQKIYHYLDKIEDPVFFHEKWFDDIQTIQNADMIIFSEQSNEIAQFRDVAFAVNEKKIHILSDTPNIMELFDIRDRLVAFDWKKEVFRKEYLFEDRLFEVAKKINLRYAHLYNKVEETPQNAELEWKKLNSFTKYSNISSADYHDVRKAMLKNWNLPITGEGLSDEQLDTLARLEHIRWCRYHYLANWTYGIPADGKNKDADRRIHFDLLPFDQLSEEDKQKDKNTIRVMLGLAES